MSAFLLLSLPGSRNGDVSILTVGARAWFTAGVLADNGTCLLYTSNLLLENIEALAAGETGSGGACVGRGSVFCPLTKEGVEHVHIYYSMPH